MFFVPEINDDDDDGGMNFKIDADIQTTEIFIEKKLLKIAQYIEGYQVKLGKNVSWIRTKCFSLASGSVASCRSQVSYPRLNCLPGSSTSRPTRSRLLLQLFDKIAVGKFEISTIQLSDCTTK